MTAAALAKPLVCDSGPMDGAEVPRPWVKDGLLVRGVVSSLHHPLSKENGMMTWVWSRVSSAAERAVVYRLNSTGDRLLFEGYAGPG